jgi:hypothetical protein
MSRRPSALVSPEQPRRNASAALARGDLLTIEVGRPKQIDQYIDYFGEPGESSLSPRLAPRAQPSPSD